MKIVSGLIVVILLALCPVLAAADTPPSDEWRYPQRLQNAMIWAQSVPAGQEKYVAFRKSFDLADLPKTATLRIFADTRYLLWINGRYVNRGPCRFVPQRPEYDAIDVVPFLQKGKNALVVLAHHYGEKAKYKSRFMEHVPGLTASLDMLYPAGAEQTLLTDTTWRANSRTRYQPEVEAVFSSVRDNIDARIDADADWTQVDFDDSKWESAIATDGGAWGPLHRRNIPLLRETEIVPDKIMTEVAPDLSPTSPVLPTSLAERLPMTLTKGRQVMIDLGRTLQAYSLLDFDADAGSTLEVQYAMQYYETNKRLPESALNDSPNRYIARAGRQTYMSTDTFGCRYLILRVTEGQFTFHSVKMVNRLYPYTRLGRFQCDDELLNQIWNVCMNTIEVCTEDAYTDCIDRERGQWIADGYMIGFHDACVALAGPGENNTYNCADPRLLANIIRQVGLNQLSDGRLLTLLPSNRPIDEIHAIIDDYSCLWIQALREYYDLTRDEAIVREFWPVLVKTADYFLNRRTERGLVNAREFVYFENPMIYKVCEGATINAFVYHSLLDGCYLGRLIGQNDQADIFERAAADLKIAYNEHLWSPDKCSYHGGILEGQKTKPTAHAAALALYYDLVPQDRIEPTLDWMKRFGSENPFPYTWWFFLENHYRRNTIEYDLRALRGMRDYWRHMAQYETGTTSEHFRGGSSAHEAGAAPAYFLSRYVLGVRTEERTADPKMIIEPRLAGLNQIEGTVLTRWGAVNVRWDRHTAPALRFQFEIPDGAVANVSLPAATDKPTLILNGETVMTDGRPTINAVYNNRYIRFPARAGKYEGIVLN